MHDHNHDHPHPHDHDHSHPHDHDHSHVHRAHGHDHHHHDHEHGHGPIGWLKTVFHFHGHSQQQAKLASDQAFLDNQEGIRTVWIALALLLVTSILQVIVVFWSGSVALLGDTIHNIGDGLNSIPLLIAFYLARRVATRRYTYGFARAEDVAGIFIIFSIAFSAFIIFKESNRTLPEPAAADKFRLAGGRSHHRFSGQ